MIYDIYDVCTAAGKMGLGMSYGSLFLKFQQEFKTKQSCVLSYVTAIKGRCVAKAAGSHLLNIVIQKCYLRHRISRSLIACLNDLLRPLLDPFICRAIPADLQEKISQDLLMEKMESKPMAKRGKTPAILRKPPIAAKLQ